MAIGRENATHCQEVSRAFHRDAPILRLLFDEETTADQATEIGQAILALRSVRLTEIAIQMRGKELGGLQTHSALPGVGRPRLVLWRLLDNQAEFVIGDPAEIERPQAPKTEYVGTLKDGEGF